MTPQDQKKLDAITDAFTKVLIANAFDDVRCYADLAERLAVLVDLEIKQNLDLEKNLAFIPYWPLGSMN